ncbi:hypothetical protein [Glaciihabitans sp. UYNi722]|uniref:hypothetical protein n=1 Tax=Glaciihabitans sp. UYNi722 TaxID=3156344 RepID=UPI003392A126
MIKVTPEHLSLIDQLHRNPNQSWGESALLSCLDRLQAGGPTEAEEVKVHDGWAFDDGFCLIYKSPWGPTVGVRVEASGRQFIGAHADEPTAAEFGIDIADFTVAEPLGSSSYRLACDTTGLGWWGDRPFPLERSA